MAPDLIEYLRKRDRARTPEPFPGELTTGAGDSFVIQQHHARRLHWDVRLEHEGALASWAVPMGLPMEPELTRLAVRTEDHPLEYAKFEGEIPAGEYGGGRMVIWDRGRYETRHWSDRKVDVVLHGARVGGRYLFVRTNGDRDWLARRLDSAPSDWESLPEFLPPMRARPGPLPATEEDREWAYEFDWDGVTALARVQGGRVRLLDRSGADLTAAYPELREFGGQLGSTEALIEGSLVAFENGTPSRAALERRAGASAARAKRLAEREPVWFLPSDLLHLDGRSCLDLSYVRRRKLLEELELTGPNWRVPEYYLGDGGAVLRAAVAHGLPGVRAKYAESPYQPGKQSPQWTAVTGAGVQEVVVGGWRPGGGSRAATFGSLLLGVPEGDRLRYVGNVGTGFTRDALESLSKRLRRLSRKTSPFHQVPGPQSRDASWVSPALVGEVVFRGWTDAACLRTPRWRGLRPGRRAEDVRLGE